MKKTVLFVSTVLPVVFSFVLWAAPPPSAHTPQEKLWRDIAQAAEKGIDDPQTHARMARFLKEFPTDPKVPHIAYMICENAFLKNNFESAAAKFEKFIADFPKHPLADSAAYRRAESYYNQKAYQSALLAWQEMIKNYRSSALVAEAMHNIATLYMMQGDWGRADEQFNVLENSFPQYAVQPAVKEKRAAVYHHLREHERAIHITEDLKEGMGLYYRGLALFSLTLYDGAVNALLALETEKSGLYKESSLFLAGEGLFQNRSHNVAVAQFEKFIKTYPKSPLAVYAHLRLAASQYVRGEPEAALKSIENLSKLNPPFAVRIHARFLEGLALLDRKRYDAAGRAFADVSARGEFPDLAAEALLRKIWTAKNQGDRQSFYADIRLMEEKFPSSSAMAGATFLKGAQLFEEEKWVEAATELEAGLVRYPYSVISDIQLALMSVALHNAKRPDQLITSANAALRIVRDHFSTASPHWRAQAHYFVGRAYFDLKRYDQAVGHFEYVSTHFSDHALAAPAQMHLAWCLLEERRFDRARDVAQKLIDNKNTPDELKTQARYLTAVSYFNAQDYDRAIPQLSQFIDAHKNHALAPEARYLMGLGFYQKKTFGSAIEEWTKCLKDYPQHPLTKEATLYIGELYFKAGEYAKAANHYRQFQERWPGDPLSQAALWQEAQSYFNGKDDESAIRRYPVYIEKYPESDNIVNARNQLEMVYFRRGAHGEPEKIIEFLRRYPKSPFAPSARFKLGEMAIEQNKWTLVTQEMENFLRDYPQDVLAMDALYALGQAYEHLEETDKAIIQYKHIIDRHAKRPEAVDAAFRLGVLHFNQENYQEAVDAFQVAAKKKMEPDVRASLTYNMALCYENLGQVENAAKTYASFAALSKDDQTRREALMAAGVLYKNIEKHSLAARQFNLLLRNSGDSETEMKALVLLGDSQQKMKRPKDAVKTYARLLTAEPAGDDLRLTGLAQLAYVYETQNRWQDALVVYEKITVSGGKTEWIAAARERIDIIGAKRNAAP